MTHWGLVLSFHLIFVCLVSEYVIKIYLLSEAWGDSILVFWGFVVWGVYLHPLYCYAYDSLTKKEREDIK